MKLVIEGADDYEAIKSKKNVPQIECTEKSRQAIKDFL
jgi:hypothetical protein